MRLGNTNPDVAITPLGCQCSHALCRNHGLEIARYQQKNVSVFPHDKASYKKYNSGFERCKVLQVMQCMAKMQNGHQLQLPLSSQTRKKRKREVDTFRRS